VSDTPECCNCGENAHGQIVVSIHGAGFESRFFCEDCAGDREFTTEVNNHE